MHIKTCMRLLCFSMRSWRPDSSRGSHTRVTESGCALSMLVTDWTARQTNEEEVETARQAMIWVMLLPCRRPRVGRAEMKSLKEAPGQQGPGGQQEGACGTIHLLSPIRNPPQMRPALGTQQVKYQDTIEACQKASYVFLLILTKLRS